MDATKRNYQLGILNHFGFNGIDAMRNKLSGYAWLVCISPQQLENVGGLERMREWQVFHEVSPLTNGGALWQLTPDVERISREENRKMVENLRPYLDIAKYGTIDQTPPSFRMELEISDFEEREDGSVEFSMPC